MNVLHLPHKHIIEPTMVLQMVKVRPSVQLLEMPQFQRKPFLLNGNMTEIFKVSYFSKKGKFIP